MITSQKSVDGEFEQENRQDDCISFIDVTVDVLDNH